ncbi:hypothetical protein BUY94_05855 [Mammaliicoccus fleurettii]|uniref:hypothetical protein n=1 Tax=Mammaliicoccus fleurettii TaxID=150056 RepID=UPI000D1CF051|nr:hypothetical protein [Mammaliicoccus fleurettii]PTE33834.1 hypothetical protein BUY94_05855 [Mammaliicoccus fleurettii]
MRELGLIYFILLSGGILLYKGVDFVTASYFAVLIAGMLAYLYVNILEFKKPNVDGNQQKATNNLKK